MIHITQREAMDQGIWFSSYMKPTPDGWGFDDEAAITDFLEHGEVDAEGVFRWNSNGQVPPNDVLLSFAFAGAEDRGFNMGNSQRAGEEERAAFISRYRETYKGPSAEERAEARAAHGEGVELVNIITGHRWTT